MRNKQELTYSILVYGFLATIVLMAFVIGCTPEKPKQGLIGPAGHAPIITTMPADASTCPTGGITIRIDSQAPVTICNGDKGLPGNNGQDGAPGADGTDATPVTLIKICPGTTVYPSVFVEYAMCVDDELYGVYSTHGGFLTYLPPGDYTSNAVGSQCNLTVHEHCEITWP